MGKLAVLTMAVTAMLSAVAAAKADSVPIKRGYYVEKDTPCQSASNATISLYDGKSFGNAHVECRKPSIRKLTDGSYQIVEQCRDVQGRGGPWGPFTTNYVVISQTEFTLTTKYGKASYRYCAQSDLPDPWNTNDLHSIGVK